MHQHIRLLLSFVFLALVPGVGQAGHYKKLLKVVPDDVSLVLAINDLKGHWKKMEKLPWTGRFLDSPVGRALRDKAAVSHFKTANEAVKSFLGVSAKDLVEKLLGDSVVIAFRHSPTSKQKDERGLLLLWVEDSELLSRVIRIVHKLQPPGTLKKLQYRGVTYYLRKDPKQDQFYFQKENLFAFSGHAQVLHQVIDRHKDTKKEAKRSPVELGFQGLPADDSILTFWVNPRAFDADLAREQQRAKGNDAQVIAGFRPYWKALDSAAATLRVADRVTLALHLRGRAEALPKSGKQFLAPASPSELWQRFPEGAVCTVAGKTNIPAFLDAVKGFLSPEDQKKFEANVQRDIGAKLVRNVFEDVLPRLGPDVGFCVCPSQDSPIPHVLAAINIREDSADPTLGRDLYRSLQFFAALGQYHHNRQNPHGPLVRVKRVTQKGVEITFVEHKSFPLGASPAFALKDGYLVIANSPKAILLFEKTNRPIANKPIGRFSFRTLLAGLKMHRKWAIQSLSKSNDMAPATAGAWFDNALKMLALVDRLELRQETQNGQMNWALHLYPSKIREQGTGNGE